ncbi:hypothetical protein Q4561_09890 [Alteromonas sp. 1_MG-2023]|uniref:hypothetical protein n=1 Tax=Alteromonas sp. 1_MG-2023 TaxID=3062669 RepID=UPI0026E2F33E|nr:hypothetical protein [Alteromonas sp. 1_MG-2023]MDO6567369.1 hypothetical protein [Alteromonas sp. 1_MG-2023]
MRFLPLFILTLVVSPPKIVHAREGVLVVANLADSSLVLSKSEIRSVFMGGSTKGLSPVEFVPGSYIRKVFNTRVIGLPEARIQSFWAQMRFSGRSSPPVSVDSIDEMLLFLAEHKASVGYLPEGTSLPKGLTVIYESI